MVISGCRRPSRRRLPPDAAHARGRGRDLPPRPGRDPGRDRGRPDHGLDPDLPRRGHRRGARRPASAMPVAISFTVETDGRLPTGRICGDAIELVDAATDGGAAYFMINCAHPDHFARRLADGAAWRERIRGHARQRLAQSHAELDDVATELDAGRPGRARSPVRRPRELLPPAHGPRRLLRHRRSPRPRDRPRLPRARLSALVGRDRCDHAWPTRGRSHPSHDRHRFVEAPERRRAGARSPGHPGARAAAVVDGLHDDPERAGADARRGRAGRRPLPARPSNPVGTILVRGPVRSLDARWRFPWPGSSRPAATTRCSSRVEARSARAARSSRW